MLLESCLGKESSTLLCFSEGSKEREVKAIIQPKIEHEAGDGNYRALKQTRQ